MKICQYCGSPAGDAAQDCSGCGARLFFHQCDQCGEVFDSVFCPRCGLKAGEKAKICPECAARYHSAVCPDCGYMPGRSRAAFYAEYTEPVPAVSPKSRLAALVLALLAGIFGVHRFYAGKIGTGILYLLTGGLGGIGVIVDVLLILLGSFKDKAGLPLTNW